MSAYLDAMDVRLERTRQFFALFNEGRFQELLAQYADDVVSFIPDIVPSDGLDLRYAKGKTQYLLHLQLVRDRHGPLHVTSVFAVGDYTDIQVVDVAGNIGSFAVHLSEDGLIKRIFFLHHAGKNSRTPPERGPGDTRPDATRPDAAP